MMTTFSSTRVVKVTGRDVRGAENETGIEQLTESPPSKLLSLIS